MFQLSDGRKVTDESMNKWLAKHHEVTYEMADIDLQIAGLKIRRKELEERLRAMFNYPKKN